MLFIAPPATRFVWRASAKHLSYPLRRYLRRAPRTTKTEQWAWRTTESETLPRRARLAPPNPRLPITTRRSYRRQQREQQDLRDAGRLQSYLRISRFMITPALP
jgi:hypothetical protein